MALLTALFATVLLMELGVSILLLGSAETAFFTGYRGEFAKLACQIASDRTHAANCREATQQRGARRHQAHRSHRKGTKSYQHAIKRAATKGADINQQH